MPQRNILLSVVIPALNEEESISKTLTEVEQYLSQRGWSHEIIVINDGSTDRTGQVVRNWSRVQHPVTLLENVQNRGKGYAVKQGILSSRGQWVLFMDADGSTSIKEIENLWSSGVPPAMTDYDLAIGSRRVSGAKIAAHQKWHREWMWRGFTWIANLLLWMRIRDYTCGFKCFRREVGIQLFRKQRIERWGFDAEILFLARKGGCRIKEFPVLWHDVHKTNVRLFRDTVGSLLELLKIRWNQLRGSYR